MKTLLGLFFIVVISSAQQLSGSVLELPTGQFLCESRDSKEEPMASIASITPQPDGSYLLRIRDWFRNSKEITLKVRGFEVQGRQKEILAFEGITEQKDRDGGPTVYSFRVAGVVSDDGSLDGTMIGFSPAGFQGSWREGAVTRKFRLRSLEAEQDAALKVQE